ncbi:MAG TPA: DegT/DnrJ/EryC1/StrS family aminotransferase [Bacillota bacterium]|nr:DegT/DnrJ/EryC1/StrS family aminotransferase [Bacillota bacterium]
MRIPVFDLTRQNKLLENALDSAFHSVLTSGSFILGEEVKQFEEKIAQYLDARFAVGVASGSDALLLSLLALGIQAGDEVIVPSFTFFATAAAVSRIGAIPVFVDVSAADYNLDPDQIEVNLTAKTKAIIPVHLFGRPANMAAILQIAKEHGLAVIEDCAQSLGAAYDDQPVGTLGDVGCFSFYPHQNLGGLGDGGMVVTNRADLNEKVRTLRVHGAPRRYYHELLGVNSRLDALQAAFLRVKLPYLNQWIRARRQIAGNYHEGLKSTSGFKLPALSDDHTFNQFTLVTEWRDELRSFLGEKEIETAIYYPLPLHLQPIFRSFGYKEGDLPVSEGLSRRALSLPMFPELGDSEQNRIIAKIQEFFKKRNSK